MIFENHTITSYFLPNHASGAGGAKIAAFGKDRANLEGN